MAVAIFISLTAGVVTGTSSAQGTGVSRVLQETPPPRSLTALGLDASRNIVLFGGYVQATDEYLNDTWTWDGTSWTERFPASSPDIRSSFQMAYDAARRQLVLYGGYGGPPGQRDYYDDTWTWDGTNWTEQHPATNPPVAAGYGMAYDAARKQVLMFSGEGLALQPMWAWDGTDWTELLPDTVPTWRDAHRLAYDGARRQTVMFGGVDCPEYCIVYDETWVWNGSNWIEKHPGLHPRRRWLQGMAYDATRRLVVLFGGNVLAGIANDTWTWDGRAWKRLSPNRTPQPREGMGMA